jgi:RHS repeat-associated protein
LNWLLWKEGSSAHLSRNPSTHGNLEWSGADALNPIAELDQNGNIKATFIHSTRAHVPDAMVMTDGTVYRFITDHLGSVRLVVNAGTGEVAERMDYDAFGRVLQDTNPGFQPFGFAGGLYDDDTGLVRFGARDYDAHAGRWTAKDPVLFNGSDENLYAYSFSDPINFIDVYGTDALDVANWLDNVRNGRWPGLFPGQGPGWHHNRNIHQEGLCSPRNPTMDACSPDFEQFAPFAPFHGFETDVRGRGDLAGVQCIYDSAGNLVTDPLLEGSFDYFPPSESYWEHTRWDVWPWFLHGN